MPIKDLTGRRFGKLTVIKISHIEENGKVFWICQCECNNTIIARGSALKDGGIKTCGESKCRVKNLVNKKFGRLTVLKFIEIKNEESVWECLCECGVYKNKTYSSLKEDIKTSCGCSKYDNREDLTGKKFGRLTIIRLSGIHNNKTFWVCQCECNKIVRVASKELKNNSTKSCGCYQKDKTKEIITGNTWGRKYNDPSKFTAKCVWESNYTDGCSFEKFMELSQLPCFYCGNIQSNHFNKYLTKENKITGKVSQEWAEKAGFSYNGLDRIDSSQNHNEDNIVPCCYLCNTAKMDMIQENFIKHIHKISNHLREKEKLQQKESKSDGHWEQLEFKF